MTHYSRRTYLVLAGTAVASGLAGCSGSGSTPASTASPTPSSDSAEPTASETATEATGTETAATGAEVAMITDNDGSYFDPVGLHVDPGTTVTFVNDSGDHSTTAYHPTYGDYPLRIPEAADPWDSGVYTEAGRRVSVTFDVEGVYDYYCTPHEAMGMVGRIVVGGPQGGPGTTEPTDLPPAARDTLPPIDAIVEQGSIPGP